MLRFKNAENDGNLGSEVLRTQTVMKLAYYNSIERLLQIKYMKPLMEITDKDQIGRWLDQSVI